MVKILVQVKFCHLEGGSEREKTGPEGFSPWIFASEYQKFLTVLCKEREILKQHSASPITQKPHSP